METSLRVGNLSRLVLPDSDNDPDPELNPRTRASLSAGEGANAREEMIEKNEGGSMASFGVVEFKGAVEVRPAGSDVVEEDKSAEGAKVL